MTQVTIEAVREAVLKAIRECPTLTLINSRVELDTRMDHLGLDSLDRVVIFDTIESLLGLNFVFDPEFKDYLSPVTVADFATMLLSEILSRSPEEDEDNPPDNELEEEDTVSAEPRETSPAPSCKESASADIWSMPEWMKGYLPIGHCNSREELENWMNRKDTVVENAPAALCICSIKGAVSMLVHLNLRGLLKPSE